MCICVLLGMEPRLSGMLKHTSSISFCPMCGEDHRDDSESPLPPPKFFEDMQLDLGLAEHYFCVPESCVNIYILLI